LMFALIDAMGVLIIINAALSIMDYPIIL